MNDFIFNAPVKVFFGKDAHDNLDDLCKGKKVLLVYGGNSLKANGTYSKLIKALKNADVFDFGGNTSPDFKKVKEAVDICKNNNIDIVIGAGGSSCMDMSKIIAFGAANDVDLWKFVEERDSRPDAKHLPVILIPTFPMGGSEVDGASEIDDFETGRHGAIYDMFGNYAILNPEFTYGLDKNATAYGAIATIVQLATKFVGNFTVSREFAKTLIINTMKQLDAAIKDPNNYEARADLMWAASMGTMGILDCGKTYGYGDDFYNVEGIGEELCGIQYREAICIIFPHWLKGLAKRHGEDILELMSLFGADGIDEGAEKITAMFENYGIKMYYDDFAPLDESKLSEILIRRRGRSEEFSEDELREMIHSGFKTL
ncbi:MAG: iron-containing alcohol dehydrogenase [Firmicutes bacterium]|nr:iron-containing alcohol dehydrogenase [Bacillota bacterium]